MNDQQFCSDSPFIPSLSVLEIVFLIMLHNPCCVQRVTLYISQTSLPCVYLQESPMHKALFWVAVAVLQLDEVNLYSAGTALLEQNLHTLDTMRVFNDKVNT